MKPLAHSLFSHNEDKTIAFFEKFNKEDIKQAIIKHLKDNPTDVIEHCKEYNKEDRKRFYRYEIINFYGVNPKSGEVSLIFTRGNKNYFRSIEKMTESG